jgi:hypothetical protein
MYSFQAIGARSVIIQAGYPVRRITQVQNGLYAASGAQTGTCNTCLGRHNFPSCGKKRPGA